MAIGNTCHDTCNLNYDSDSVVHTELDVFSMHTLYTTMPTTVMYCQSDIHFQCIYVYIVGN